MFLLWFAAGRFPKCMIALFLYILKLFLDPSDIIPILPKNIQPVSYH